MACLHETNSQLSDTVYKLSTEIISLKESDIVQNMLLTSYKTSSEQAEIDSNKFMDAYLQEKSTQIAELKWISTRIT